MNFSRILTILILLILFTPQNVKARSILDICYQAMSLLPLSQTIDSRTGLSPKNLEELRAVHEASLGHKSKVAIPKLFLNGKVYETILMLGEGGEGQVFLVKNNQRQFALKVFRDSEKFNENLKVAGQLRNLGTPMTLPIEVDHSRRSVLFPYVDGPSLDIILNPHLQHIAVSQETVAAVSDAFDEFKMKLKFYQALNPYGDELSNQNVVIDLANNRFIIVDSR